MKRSTTTTLSVFIKAGTVVLEFNTAEGEDILLPFPPGEARSVGQALIDAEAIIERTSDD